MLEHIGELRLDGAREEATLRGVNLDVTASEYVVLALLARNAGQVVPSSEIAQALWGPVAAGRSVEVHLSRLRTKLAAVDGHRRRITTRRGVGYRYNDEARSVIVAVSYANSHGVEWVFRDSGDTLTPPQSQTWAPEKARRHLTHAVVDTDGTAIGAITVWVSPN